MFADTGKRRYILHPDETRSLQVLDAFQGASVKRGNGRVHRAVSATGAQIT